MGELELPNPEVFEFPQPGASSAVLFLIDTSDPNRGSAVRAGIKHIRQIIDAGRGHHSFGIATFDSNLNVVAEPGTLAEGLESALKGIRATGRTTELYRNALAAVRYLNTIGADRKSLVILSDGLAEDRAYYHADVVRLALGSGVTIDGLGYPRSVSLSVGLQTLRRLAEETGGRFVEGNTRFQLPKTYLTTPFTSSDSGGTLLLDLTSAIDAGASGAATVQLEWPVGTSRERIAVPVQLPPPPPPPAPAVVVPPDAVQSPAVSAVEEKARPAEADDGARSTPAAGDRSADAAAADADAATDGDESGVSEPAANSAAEQSSESDVGVAPDEETGPAADAAANVRSNAADAGTSLPPSSTTQAKDSGKASGPPLKLGADAPFGGLDVLSDWLWLVVLVLAVTLIGLVWALIAVLRPRRQGAAPSAERPTSVAELATQDDREVYAYLEGVDDDARYPITSAAFRVGRHADNELPIHDPSISRHHAQIHRKRDGTFTIADLESMNGVFVNDERVQSAALSEGDLIELGDVKLRFTMLAADPLGGDETVMVRTHMPGNMTTAA
ncbi:MAG: FHA domain-containing protein [Pseudomonadota bacterium]